MKSGSQGGTDYGAAATIIRGMGVMELGVVALTETKPPLGERVRQELS